MTHAITLPPGKSLDEAVRIAKQHREVIWRTVAGPEDRRLEQLQLVCERMCLGDVASGKRLATMAIYTP